MSFVFRCWAIVVFCCFAVPLFAGCSPNTSSETPPGAGDSPGRESPDSAAREECAIVAPAELPSGAPVGDPRPVEGDEADSGDRVQWGEGLDRVVQAVGADARTAAGEGNDDVDNWPESAVVRVDGAPRLVMPVGDPGEIQIHVIIENCYYLHWVGPGLTIEEARDYAARL